MLAARTRDVAGAEDALSEAFAAALRSWPVEGIPHNPDAWLLTVARRRQADDARRRQTRSAGQAHVLLIADELEALAGEGDELPDRRLALMFACAHPAIERGMRTPLILQTILGLTAEAIAAAFLIPAKTMGQRLVRAKLRIRDAGIPFRVPESEELPETYQPYWAAKGHLHALAGDAERAAEALTLAIGLSTEEAVKAYLCARLAQLRPA